LIDNVAWLLLAAAATAGPLIESPAAGAGCGCTVPVRECNSMKHHSLSQHLRCHSIAYDFKHCLSLGKKSLLNLATTGTKLSISSCFDHFELALALDGTQCCFDWSRHVLALG